MADVLTFGETMAVVRGPGPLRLGGHMNLSIAGAESNVAIGLARLGQRTEWIGRVGNDEPGALIRRTLRAEDVATDHTRTDPTGPTGLMLAEQRVGSVTRVTYYRAASAGSQLQAEDVLPAITANLRLLHVTGITPALSESSRECLRQSVQRAHDLGITVSFDVNYRSRLWSPDQARRTLDPLLDLVDIVFASADELTLVADGADDLTTATRALLDRGIGQVIVKLGHDGARVHTRELSHAAPARPVPVVDVVGAGDAFVAGYLSAWLDGCDLPTRLDRAVTTAAFTVARQGDWEGLPTRAELPLLKLETGATVR